MRRFKLKIKKSTHSRSAAFLHCDFIIWVAIVTGVEEGFVNVSLSARFALHVFVSRGHAAVSLPGLFTSIWKPIKMDTDRKTFHSQKYFKSIWKKLKSLPSETIRRKLPLFRRIRRLLLLVTFLVKGRQVAGVDGAHRDVTQAFQIWVLQGIFCK